MILLVGVANSVRGRSMAVLALTMAAAASGSYKGDEVSMVTSTRTRSASSRAEKERTTYGSTEIAEIGEDLRKLKTLHEG